VEAIKSIPALGADNPWMFMVVVNGQVIAEIMADGDVMPAIKTEFPAFQVGNYFSESVRILIKLFLLFGHQLPPNRKSPLTAARRPKGFSGK